MNSWVGTSIIFGYHIKEIDNIIIDGMRGGPAIPYSRKYWRELNLANEPKIAIARILADLNLAVQYRIAIRIYASRKFWRILIWRL